MSKRKQPDGGGGMPVDSNGSVAYDPSKNVRDLVDAESRRQDDLRIATKELTDSKVGHQKEISDLRAEHNKEIRHMESDRVDKIRSVDVANAAATAAQLLSAVTTLATTAQATAETLRNQVAATAAAVASQTERVVNPIIERLALLEKSSNFGQGRAELANPAMTEAIIEMRKLATGVSERQGRDSMTDPAVASALVDIKTLLAAQSTGTGKSQGINLVWVAALGAVALISGVLGIAGVLYAALKP